MVPCPLSNRGSLRAAVFLCANISLLVSYFQRTLTTIDAGATFDHVPRTTQSESRRNRTRSPSADEVAATIRPWCIQTPPMPNIPKRDRRRPWKAKPKNTKAARSFRDDGTPIRPFDGVPTGSELDPQLKTARWQRLRAKVIQMFPLCPICDHMGRTTPSTECDHISPRQRGEFSLFDISNLWALCSDCHAVKSQLERQGKHHQTMEGWTKHVARIRTKRG